MVIPGERISASLRQEPPLDLHPVAAEWGPPQLRHQLRRQLPVARHGGAIVVLMGSEVLEQMRRRGKDVVIAEQHPITVRSSGASVAGAGGAAAVLSLELEANPPIWEFVDDPRGDVVRSVVDDNHLVAIGRIVELDQRGESLPQRVRPPKRGNDDRERRSRPLGGYI